MISFDTAYHWLNQFTPSSMSYVTRQAALRLQQGLRGYRHARVYGDITMLLSSGAGSMVSEELAECHVLAGYAAYKLSDLPTALDHLDQAAKLFGSLNHPCAVVRWLQGWVLWSMSDGSNRSRAMLSFNESMQLFEILETNFQFSIDVRRHWYCYRLVEMKETIRQMMRLAGDWPTDETDTTAESAGTPPPVSEWHPEYPADSEEAREEKAPAEEPIPVGPETDLFSILFQTFPVSDTVPAGGFGPTGNDPEPLAYLQIDRLVIDGRLYRMRPLKRNGQVINLTGYLNRGCKLNAVRIHGDSMNKIGIDDGDYVLIAIQEDAEDREIVVAGIENEDSQATIKRLRKINGQVILWPESTNPDHQPRLIGPDDQFRIIGTALAVLKAVEPASAA